MPCALLAEGTAQGKEWTSWKRKSLRVAEYRAVAVPVEGGTMHSECEAVALLSCHLFYKKPQLVVGQAGHL